MTYEPLHHKYRPQTFADLVGQAAIATTLTNAINQERIAPAYLFTGPRGTGKTSSARILAKSLNCLQSSKPTPQPCGGCEVCRAIARGEALDVIEIDAASNTGVDNIRELIDRAQFAPVQCRYKVFIIDEVHMLSTSAFNSLLKTLEEPPAHVVFVLATTDPQRVLPTIISRCQRFDYRRIPLEAMVGHLRAIATQEAIDIAEDALNLVAQIAQGGLRDAESLLDQLSLLSGQITIGRVWDLVGAVPEQDLLQLLVAIAADDPEAVLDQTRYLMERGREPLVVLQNLAGFYRDLLIAKTAPRRQDLVAITPDTWEQLCEFAQTLDIGTILAGQQHLRSCEVQVKNTTQPRLWLEVTLLGLLPSSLISTANTQLSTSSPTSRVKVTTPSQSRSVPEQTTIAASQPERGSPPEPTPSAPAPPAQTPEFTQTQAPISSSNNAQTGSVNGRTGEGSSSPPSPASNSFQPEKDFQPTPASAALPTSDIASVDLDATWQKVLQHAHPPGTQALLRQHARLLALKGREARLGLKTQPLFKMAQERLTNVEAAFQAALGHPVKVKLEVVAGSDPTPAVQNSSPGNSPVHPHPSDKDVSPEPAFNGNPVPATRSLETPALVHQPTPEPPAERLPVSELQQPYWQDANELTKAAKSLAQFFNGVVVDPEIGEIGSSETTVDSSELLAVTPTDPSLDEPELEPDDELPF